VTPSKKVDGKPVLMMYQKKLGIFTILKRLRELAVSDGFPGCTSL